MEFVDANLISVLNGLAIGLLLFVTAVGLSLIFGLMDVLNLAHGAVYLVGSYVAYQLTSNAAGNLYVAAAVALGVGAVLGVGLAAAIRPIRDRGHLDQALLTFGYAVIIAEVAAIVWGNDIRSARPPELLAGSHSILGNSYPRYRLAVIVVGAVVAVVVYLLFERTRLGAIVRATVEDRAMVAAQGISVNLVVVGVLVFGAALASFAGVIGAPILGVGPGIDEQILVLSLIVVVIGGLGSIRGALLGALLIGQVRTLGAVYFPDIASFLLFGVMAVVLTFRPEGLFAEGT